MTTGGAGPLVPTFHGFVHNSMDGLILFEACLSGKLNHVPRRPHDRERNSLIKSGSIFIYEENASGIKRWTDGVAWSPSRILGNFLIYRELEKPFPPGEKKRAMKRKRTSAPGEPYPRRESEAQIQQPEQNDVQRPLTPPTPSIGDDQKPNVTGDADKDLERQLIGSLVDSYGFRPDGLVKKTMSISVNGISHHMVSYYKVEDVKRNVLPRPTTDPRLQTIQVRPELYLKQNFRAPVEEGDHYPMDQQSLHMQQQMYQQVGNSAYAVRPGQYFAGQQQPYPMYGMPVSGANMYQSATSTAWPATPTSATGTIAYGAHPAYTAQAYPNTYYRDTPQSGTPVKSEEHTQSSAHSVNGYNGQYASAYPNMQRDNSQASNGMIASNYPTPVAQQTQQFSSMSAPNGRSYSTSAASGNVANGAHHMYSGTQSGPSIPSQGYHVRSPTQQYGMGNGSSNTTAQSPHHSVKSPVTTQGTDHMHNGHISYSRQNSYGVPQAPQSAGHSASDINGLGISSNAAYAGYGAAGQAFRPVAEVGGAQGSQHYGQ